MGDIVKRRYQRNESGEMQQVLTDDRGRPGWPSSPAYSTMTPEGYIAGVGVVSRGITHAPGWGGVFKRFVVLLWFPPAAIARLIADLWDINSRWRARRAG
jgi:hypothetical protein